MEILLRWLIIISGIYQILSLKFDLDSLPCSNSEACPPGSFSCNGTYPTVVCLEQRFFCDGKPHCPAGEDELPENCFYRDHAATAVVLGSVNTSVQLETDTSNEYYPCWQEAIQRDCRCKDDGRQLYCDDKRLSVFPKLTRNITKLFLFNNTVSAITTSSLQNGDNLRVLHLRNNTIRTIDPGVFNTTKLIFIFLSENKLQRLTNDMFTGLYNLSWMHLSFNQINHIEAETFDNLHNLEWLDLRHNSIYCENGDRMSLPPNLVMLDLDNNRLKYIGASTFSKALNLTSIHLNNNLIYYIEPDAFALHKNLRNLEISNNHLRTLNFQLHTNQLLKTLHLAWNPITIIPDSLFAGLFLLEELNLTGVVIRNMNSELFNGLDKLCFIYFKVFRYCLYTPQVKNCFPKSDGISTAENLLHLTVLRVSIWVIAVLTCLSNALVFLGRVIVVEENKIHSMFIKNLCMSDFLMGVYLFIVACQDTKTRDKYLYYALTWQSSWLCHFSGVLAMISSEVSVLILTVMSIDRYIIISNPFSRRRLSSRSAVLCLCSLWLVGGLLAAIPFTSSDWFGDYYGSNGVCFPLHIHDPYETAWQYSAFVFLGVNSLSMVLIVFCYGSMLRSIVSTRQSASNNEAGDLSFARRFFLIVFTDAACWIPIIIIKFLAFTTLRIPDTSYSWLAIFVLPVNSAINPILYSLSSLSFRRHLTVAIVEKRSSDLSDGIFRGNSTKTYRPSITSSNATTSDKRRHFSHTHRVRTRRCLLACLLHVSRENIRSSEPATAVSASSTHYLNEKVHLVELLTQRSSEEHVINLSGGSVLRTCSSINDLDLAQTCDQRRLTSTPINSDQSYHNTVTFFESIEKEIN